MTIVDVFETDSEGKLLSYCPTFDNRNVKKTDPRVEKIRKGSSRVKSHINTLSNSKTAAKVNEAAFLLGRLGLKGFVTVNSLPNGGLLTLLKLPTKLGKRDTANSEQVINNNNNN